MGPLYDSLEGKQVLEVGCGAGRFTEVLLSEGAFVTAVDISEAINVCSQQFSDSPRFRPVAANVQDLPWAEGQYDIVLCIGVIQHTPNPAKALRALVGQVSEGGYLVIDQYRHSVSAWLRPTWLVRAVLIRISPERAMAMTDALVKIFLPFHKLVRRWRVMEIVLNRLSPITSHYSQLPLSDEEQERWARLNTHDNLTDRYKHQTTRRKLERMSEYAGLVDIFSRKLPYTVELLGRKPDSTDKNVVRSSWV